MPDVQRSKFIVLENGVVYLPDASVQTAEVRAACAAIEADDAAQAAAPNMSATRVLTRLQLDAEYTRAALALAAAVCGKAASRA